MAIRLHTCGFMWMSGDYHPCARVRNALDEAGVDYELVKEPSRRGKRDDVRRLSGQERLPVIEFDDGSAYRDESTAMAAVIREGRLMEKAGPSGQAQPPS